MTSSTEPLAVRAEVPAASSEAVEDYVRAIFQTARGPRKLASTTEVAAHLTVTPASVSSMFKKLARLNFVVYEPYRGVRLTAAGERVALQVTRRHRLLETFLVETLGMSLERVHAEADRLEHHISAELEDLIAARLGNRPVDPHGDPIPTADLRLPADDTVSLVDIRPGEDGHVASVPDGDPDMLRYLSEVAGIAPGAPFVVRDRHPFGGPVVLDVDERRIVLGSPLAALVRVHTGRRPSTLREDLSGRAIELQIKPDGDSTPARGTRPKRPASNEAATRPVAVRGHVP